MAGSLLQRYCARTTVHGLKYFSRKQNVIQKIFWAVMITLSIFCTLWLIASLNDQISKNPIVIYRNDTPIDATKIFFPAFTMCEIDNSKFNDTRMDVDWLQELIISTTVIPTELGLCKTVNFCDQNLFLSDEVDKKRIFKYVYAWFDPDIPENETQPFRTTSLNLGLVISVFHRNLITLVDPFLLMIHSPFELPTNENQKFYVSGLDYDNFFVTPQLVTIDDSMIAMEPHERNCFLPHEKNLTLYKVYNEANCKAECKSNFIAAGCGCVPEHIVANASIDICNYVSEMCITEVEFKFKSVVGGKCGCLPSCEYVTYIVEKVKADFTGSNFLHNRGGLSAVILHIRFKPGDHFPMVRRKHFTVTEIFAFTGGLLGLFLGISVVTFAEVVNVLLHPLFEKFSTASYFRKTPSCINRSRFGISKAIARVMSYFSFYLKESSIHSFNFFANAGNCFERIFWFLSFSTSMTGCVLMILQLYRTMDFKAITVVIDDQLMDVSEVPFPAVTIYAKFPTLEKFWYPKMKSSKDDEPVGNRVPNTRHFETSEHPTSKMAALVFLTRSPPWSYHENFEQYLNYTDHEKYIVKEIRKLSKTEWFKQQKASFGKFSSAPFVETLTSRGVAFTFNILNDDKLLNMDAISNDFYYERNAVLGDGLRKINSEFPWHASISDSLELELIVDPEAMMAYSEAFSVHSTTELPMMIKTVEIFDFAGGKHLEVLITPNIMRSDESLKLLAPSDRSCYFEGERKLQFFKVYTKRNCEIECYSNYYQKLCDCVEFDVIRNSETTVCGLHDSHYECSYQHGFDEEFRKYRLLGQLKSCSCLPTCDLISYSIEVRDSKLRKDEFGDVAYSPMRRKLQYTIIDFLSYIGGVLGLFAGISVLSFFEIFYFFSLRILLNFFVRKEATRHFVIIVRPAK